MFRKTICSSSTFCLKAVSASPVQKSFPQYAFTTVKNFSLVPIGNEPLHERVKMIDTTLTAEQQAYVATLKHKLKGGPKSPKSIYREVPKQNEIVGMGNFMPRVAENAEELIDFALSHIPKKVGPRRSRYKRRLELKSEKKLAFDKMKKAQGQAAFQRIQVKIKNRHAECKKMWAEVHAIREKAAAIAEFKAKNSI